jgi:hypothetical protein
MAEISGPFDSGSFNEDSWDYLARGFLYDGVIMGSAFTELQLTLQSGLNGSLAIGNAAVRGFLYRNDAAKTLDFTKGGTTPPNVTNPRIDLVVLRLDRAANSITAQIKTGTPAGGPVVPIVQQDATLWEVAVAQVLIPANAVTLGTITDVRPFSYIPPSKSWVRIDKQTTQATVNTAPVTCAFPVAGAVGNATDLFNDANDELVAPIAGLWRAQFNLRLVLSGTETTDVRVLLNGTEIIRAGVPDTGQDDGVMVSFSRDFNANDRIKWSVVNFGGTRNIMANTWCGLSYDRPKV